MKNKLCGLCLLIAAGAFAHTGDAPLPLDHADAVVVDDAAVSPATRSAYRGQPARANQIKKGAKYNRGKTVQGARARQVRKVAKAHSKATSKQPSRKTSKKGGKKPLQKK